MRYYLTNQIELPNSNYELATKEQVISMLQHSLLVGLDTETTGLDPHTAEMRILTLGNGEDTYVIDIRSVGYEWIVKELNKSNRLYIAFNMKFDYQILRSYDIKLVNVYCCMIVDMCLTMGKGYKHNLAAVLLRRYEKVLEKEVRLEFINKDLTIQTRHIIYSARDVEELFSLYGTLQKEVIEYDLERLVELENKALIVLGDMEYEGILMNIPYWKTTIVEALEKRVKTANQLLVDWVVKSNYRGRFKTTKVQQSLFEQVAETKVTINWNSNPQQIELLEELGYNLEAIDKNTRKPKKSVADAVISKYTTTAYSGIREESKLISYLTTTESICDVILYYRKAAKAYNTYGEAMLDRISEKTGRLHTTFKQLGAVTGRLSSTDPNLQNIPQDSKFRAGFIAREGFKIITIDYAGAELRIMTEGSKDGVFLEAFLKDEDLHSKLAMLMPSNRGLTINKHENSHLRQKQKSANFGIAYGAGEEKFGREFMQDFKQVAPNLFIWLDSQGKFASSNGYTRTFFPFNRLVWMNKFDQVKKIIRDPEEYSLSQLDWAKGIRSSYKRYGKNFPIQGTSADITKNALVLFSLWIKVTNNEDNIFIVNQVHDEILVEVRQEMANDVVKILEYIMIEAGKPSIKLLPMTVDYHINDYWEK